MSDARYPERWLNDRRVTRLSHPAHRAYVVTMAWAVANRTDGVVLAGDLDDLPRYVAQHADELVSAGLWTPTPDGTGYVVVDFLDTQTSRAELERLDAARVAAREKKARQRSQSPNHSAPPPAVVPRDVPGDSRTDAPDHAMSRGTSRGTTQDRTGQARTGQALVTGAEQTGAGWPAVAEPGSSSLRSVPLPVPDCDCGWQLAPGEHHDACTQVSA